MCYEQPYIREFNHFLGVKIEKFKRRGVKDKCMSEDPSLLFDGKFSISLDRKNRLNIPAQYRDVLKMRNADGTAIWVVPDSRNDVPYLACFDKRDWSKNWTNVPGSLSTRLKVEKYTRILLPERLIQHAQLVTGLDGIVIAASPSHQHFEIWKNELYDKGYKIEIQGPKPWEL